MQKRSKILLQSCALLLTLALSACGGGSGGSGNSATSQNDTRDLPALQFVTNFISVPKDYLDSTVQAQISVAYSIHRATDLNDYKGILMFNFGGPGGEGIETLKEWSHHLAPEIRNKFDLVGFDPRGTGQSAFNHCFVNKEDNQCPRFARYMGTTTIIHDMESIRKHLVAKRANEIGMDVPFSFYGYSYGTRLGAVYAQAFGDNLRSLVLDSPMDPQQTNIWEWAQDKADAFGIVAKYRLKQSQYPENTYDNFLNLKRDARFYTVLEIIKSQNHKMWRNYLSTAVVHWINDPTNANWEAIKSAGNQYENARGNNPSSTPLNGTLINSQFVATLFAVSCVDNSAERPSPMPPMHDQNDMFSEVQSWAEHCTTRAYDGVFEPARAITALTPEQVTQKLGSRLPQILIIGGKYDTNTPYKWTLGTQKAFGRYAKVATIEGIASHGFGYNQISRDLDRLTTAYLLYPSQPLLDTTYQYEAEHFGESLWMRSLGLMPSNENPARLPLEIKTL